MSITVCNFASIRDGDVERVCAAINRQIAEHRVVASRVRLLGSRSEPPSRGDAIIYLWDNVADVPIALADEEPREQGLPFGFVIAEISEQLEEPWSVTLSREALALIDDLDADGVDR
jgi:hypothetical protein